MPIGIENKVITSFSMPIPIGMYIPIYRYEKII